MIDHVVVLFLTTLPLTGGTNLDRGVVAAQAGCHPATAVIAIAEEPERGWLVIVRCRVVVTPTAEILRSEPWEATRQPREVCAYGAPGPPRTSCLFNGG